jgi:sec-independent protein translocase protein TatA
MFGLGGAEIAVLLVIALLLFGSKLPGVARSLGRSFVAFRQEVNSFQDELAGRGRDVI